jgi:GNAT superfamily N-acetyltransferase
VAIDIRRATMREFWHLSGALLQKNHAEIALGLEHWAVAPDVARYAAAEQAGKVFATVAMDGSELAGYSVVFVDDHMHYAGRRVMLNDVFYVNPEHRGRSLGGRLIRASEQLARAQGAHVALWSMRHGSDMHRAMGKLPSYRLHDVSFCKELS